MRESSRAVAPWREAVRTETATALERAAAYRPPLAATVWLTFTVRRPSTHYGTGRNALTLKGNAPRHPRGRPDLDKLVRATLDALTDAGALVDDANVVTMHAVKCYPAGDLDALDVPGAVIVVGEATP
jgi:Holliday junction resolvase RusA-like endonuclease